jgi:hypothetical protein
VKLHSETENLGMPFSGNGRCAGAVERGMAPQGYDLQTESGSLPRARRAVLLGSPP